MANKKISELTAKNAKIASLDILEVSEYVSPGVYTSKYVTGEELKQNPSVQAVVSSATVTPALGNDLVTITAQAVGLTLANPSGTWVQGKDLVIRIKDNATPQTIAYGAKYRAVGITLPTTTVASKTTYLGIIYNSTDDKFDVIGVTTEA